MSVGDQIKVAAAVIRSYGAVAVFGAGLSAPRYPMTGQLPPLLWHAIDSDSDARSRLAAELGKADGTAKELIGANPAAVEAAWRFVETNHEVRKVFQEAFVRLDGDREPKPAHYALARLVHAGLVEYVISFNWDTALERAHEQLFGTSLSLRGDLLVKPHGDATNPQDHWVLPHQAGVVPSGVLDRIAELSRQRPRALLIVGYSGSDEAVVGQLLNPAQGRWPVIRVGPAADGPESVTGFADDVIPAMADALNAPVDMVGWRWVGFIRSRDLRAALMGYRLGPQDVQACPALPAARMVAERLRQARFAVIVGESGAGKSITAFQAAYQLNRQGWAVVELSQPGVASNETVRTFKSLRGPVVAVVDDAQALAPDVLSAFERAVSADHAVVVVVTEWIPGQDRVQVSSVQAVATLVQYCEAHVDELATMVGEIDDRVGYEIGREPFPRRVEAAESSHYPWQFMYVLSGGERRIRDALANLAGEGDADLLFGILAAAQLLSLDAGISQDVLLQYGEFVGWDDQWLEHGLATLAEHRLVINHRERLRTPHMRIADRGLLVLCRDHRNPRWRTLIAFLRSRLVDQAEPLQGKLWTLQAINQSDPLRYCHPELLLDEEVASLLVDACLAAPPGHERNIAAYLLWEIDWWRALSQPTARTTSPPDPGYSVTRTRLSACRR